MKEVASKVFNAAYIILTGWVMKTVVRRWIQVRAGEKFRLAGGEYTIDNCRI
jgi:hypothetical protein